MRIPCARFPSLALGCVAASFAPLPDRRCATLQTVVEEPRGEAALLECGPGNGTRLVVMVRAQVRRR